MLAQPDRSILEVSIAAGFDDAGAFARSFARHCGETPSAYKRRIGGAVVHDGFETGRGTFTGRAATAP
jgi:AraC-like DNA-binding protein